MKSGTGISMISSILIFHLFYLSAAFISFYFCFLLFIFIYLQKTAGCAHAVGIYVNNDISTRIIMFGNQISNLNAACPSPFTLVNTLIRMLFICVLLVSFIFLFLSFIYYLFINKALCDNITANSMDFCNGGSKTCCAECRIPGISPFPSLSFLFFSFFFVSRCVFFFLFLLPRLNVIYMYSVFY